jgi:hypothetical protein
VIFKGTSIAPGLESPQTVERDGMTILEIPAMGEFVKVPEKFRAECERLVGEISASFQPFGLEGTNLPAPFEALNGLWVPLKILEHVRRKQNGNALAA